MERKAKPPAKVRHRRPRADIREELLKSALVEFGAKGFDGASTRAIAARTRSGEVIWILTTFETSQLPAIAVIIWRNGRLPSSVRRPLRRSSILARRPTEIARRCLAAA